MTFRRAVFALSLFTFLASPALAADEPKVVQAILKSWESQYNIKPVYKSLNSEGDTITIEGLEAVVPAGEGAPNGGNMTLAIGKIILKGVAEQANGIFQIDNAAYSDLKLALGGANGAFTVSVPSISSEGWFVKALADNPTSQDRFRASMNIARKTTTGPITFAANGQSVTAQGSEMTWDGDVETGAGKGSFKISNIAFPENVVAVIDPTRSLKQIGYSDLSFDIGGEGKFDIAGDKVGFNFDMFYAAKDMGTIKLGAAAGEIPVALVSQLQKHEAAPDMTKLMPLTQGIKFSRLQFRFEDQSITKRILPLAAKMQGMDEPTLIASAGAMVQLSLIALKNQAFTQKAVAAVNSFLKDPKSITLSATPTQPVTVMQMMSLDPANPGAAIDQLGVNITAND